MLNFLFFLICLLAVNSFDVQTLIVNFERTENANTKEAYLIKGILYYEIPDFVLIKVNSPVNQIMKLSGYKMTIYYPETKQAFNINSKIPLSLPFASALLMASQKNYGLEQLGYQLEKNKLNGDTLFAFWKPSEKFKILVGRIITTEVKGKLVSAKSYKPNGEISTSVVYSNHIKSGRTFIPLNIKTKTYDKSCVSEELINFSQPQFNSSIPDSIKRFTIPKDAKLKVVD